MEHAKPGNNHEKGEPSVLRAMVNWSMVATMCSAGGAALIFVVAVLPFSARAWGKAGAEFPVFAQKLLDHRLAIAGGVIALITVGCVALFAMKRGVLRAAVVTLITAILIGITVSGIIGWWLMFRGLYEQAGADI